MWNTPIVDVIIKKKITSDLSVHLHVLAPDLI